MTGGAIATRRDELPTVDPRAGGPPPRRGLSAAARAPSGAGRRLHDRLGRGTAALAWLLDPAIRLIFLEKRADWVVALPLIVAAVALVSAGVAYLASTLLAATGQRVVASLHGRMARSLRAPISRCWRPTSSAAQAARFTMTRRWCATWSRAAPQDRRDLPTVVLLIGLMFWQDWSLALAVLVVLPLGGVAMRLIATHARRAAESGMKETGALSAAIGEAVTRRRVIRGLRV